VITIDVEHNSPLPSGGVGSGAKCCDNLPECGQEKILNCPPEVGAGWNTEINFQKRGWGTMVRCLNLLEEGLNCQSLSGNEATQLPPGEIRNIFYHLGESASEQKSEQSKSSIATCSVGRRDQQLLMNQPPCRTISEKLPAPDSPSHQGKSGLRHPELTSLKAVWLRRATSVPT
jgi:hypothetical protein